MLLSSYSARSNRQEQSGSPDRRLLTPGGRFIDVLPRLPDVLQPLRDSPMMRAGTSSALTEAVRSVSALRCRSLWCRGAVFGSLHRPTLAVYVSAFVCAVRVGLLGLGAVGRSLLARLGVRLALGYQWLRKEGEN